MMKRMSRRRHRHVSAGYHAGSQADDAHILSLLRVSVYVCPADRFPQGRAIKEGIEEIEQITGGGAWFEYGSQRLAVGPGTMLWHRAGEMTVHEAFADDPYRCLVIAFAVDGSSLEPPPRVSVWRSRTAVERFAEEILPAFHRADIDRRQLCRYIHATCCWQAHAAGLSRVNPVLPLALRQVLAVISSDFAEDVDVRMVAQRAGVSVPHLHALCRQHLASTPARLLEERRLRHARWLLADTRHPVAEIAAASGFASAGSFCRAFKRCQGMTPGMYRQRYAAPEGKVG